MIVRIGCIRGIDSLPFNSSSHLSTSRVCVGADLRANYIVHVYITSTAHAVVSSPFDLKIRNLVSISSQVSFKSLII